MEAINNVINFFKSITEEQLIDIGIAAIIVLFSLIISPIISYIFIKMFNIKEKDKSKIKKNPLYITIKALIVCIGIYIGILVVNPPQNVLEICKRGFQIIIICIIAKGLIELVDPKSGIVRKMRDENKIDGNKTVANFTSKILKYIIYIGTGLLILTVFDINPSSLIAGLGVGSAVVALAAQDFVKNLISGFSIMSDKPFLVGDWIEVGVNQGTVVEISFRCTKIQTSDNTIITIQNSVFTTENVVNWSRMKQRRYLLNIKLPLETNVDEIERITKKIKFVLKNNDDIDKETIQVHFDTIGLDSMNVIIYMYTNIVNYADYLVFRQGVNEQILKVLESENVKMAYPGQNVYVHQVEDNRDEVKGDKINKENKKRIQK